MKSKILLVLAISTSSAALYAQSGNVGVGTTTPQTKLHVTTQGTGGTAVLPSNVTNMALRLENGQNGQAVIQHFAAKDTSGALKQVVMGVNPTYGGGNGVFYLGPDGANQFGMDLVNGHIGMGTGAGADPVARLAISGAIKVMDGTQGAGKVLTSDVSGLASWQTPAAGIAGDYDWMKSGNAFPNSPGDTAANIYHIGGRVGIGTNNPTGKLHVYAGPSSPGGSMGIESDLPIAGVNDLDFTRSDGGAGLAIGNSVGRIRFIGKNAGGTYSTQSMIEALYNGSGGHLTFIANGGETMRLTSLNKVGIGTPTPFGKLTVSGNGAGVTPILSLTNTNVVGNPTLNIYPGYTSSVGAIAEGNQYAVVFDQDPGQGNIGAVQSLYDFHGQVRYASASTLSDRRLKENITDMNQYGLKEVMLMQPRNYTMKEYQTKDIGFIAQELKQIVPELVMGVEAENSLLSVDYSKVCLVLINAIKEQQAHIQKLEVKNAGLNKEVTGLKAEVSKVAQLHDELNALKASVEKLVPKPELAANR